MKMKTFLALELKTSMKDWKFVRINKVYNTMLYYILEVGTYIYIIHTT